MTVRRRTRRATEHEQLRLGRPRKSRRGGKRPGAGRKRTSRRVVHVARPQHRARFPVQVTVRLRRDVGSIRNRKGWQAVRRAIELAHKDDFRIVQFSVQADHLHLIVEAADAVRLSRGMQGFLVRAARRVNRSKQRRGKVFDDRFHARALTTPTAVRRSLVYVLRNADHHRQATGGRHVDPFSSGPWFDGWAFDDPNPPPLESPVAAAETWLAAAGWRKQGGPIRAGELPRVHPDLVD